MNVPRNKDSKTLKGVFKVTFFAKRKQGITKSEFSRRFAIHGEMAGPVVSRNNGSSYVQVWYSHLENIWRYLLILVLLQSHSSDSHVAWLSDKLGPVMAQQLTFADIDGMTTLWFPAAEDLANFFLDPAHEGFLNADVAEFADVSTVSIFVGDELDVV